LFKDTRLKDCLRTVRKNRRAERKTAVEDWIFRAEREKRQNGGEKGRDYERGLAVFADKES
jgi:hypothetical protein